MHLQFEQLVGVWKLLYINVTNPTYFIDYGPDLFGRIIITPESYFNAMITDHGPGLPANVSWQTATDAERGAIVDKMTIYEGPVTLVQQGNMTFTYTQVQTALNPQWVDTLQVRQAVLEETPGKKILTLIPWGNDTSGVLAPLGLSLTWQQVLPAWG